MSSEFRSLEAGSSRVSAGRIVGGRGGGLLRSPTGSVSALALGAGCGSKWVLPHSLLEFSGSHVRSDTGSRTATGLAVVGAEKSSLFG